MEICCIERFPLGLTHPYLSFILNISYIYKIKTGILLLKKKYYLYKLEIHIYICNIAYAKIAKNVIAHT